MLGTPSPTTPRTSKQRFAYNGLVIAAAFVVGMATTAYAVSKIAKGEHFGNTESALLVVLSANPAVLVASSSANIVLIIFLATVRKLVMAPRHYAFGSAGREVISDRFARVIAKIESRTALSGRRSNSPVVWIGKFLFVVILFIIPFYGGQSLKGLGVMSSHFPPRFVAFGCTIGTTIGTILIVTVSR